MKLPDFSAFKPFDDNRKRMKARASDTSFVRIDKRLKPSDLESKKPAPPAGVPREKRPAARNDAKALFSLPTLPGRAANRNILVIIVIVQLVILGDAAIVHLLFPAFGMPVGVYHIIGRDGQLLIIEKDKVMKFPRLLRDDRPQPFLMPPNR